MRKIFRCLAELSIVIFDGSINCMIMLVLGYFSVNGDMTKEVLDGIHLCIGIAVISLISTIFFFRNLNSIQRC